MLFSRARVQTRVDAELAIADEEGQPAPQPALKASRNTGRLMGPVRYALVHVKLAAYSPPTLCLLAAPLLAKLRLETRVQVPPAAHLIVDVQRPCIRARARASAEPVIADRACPPEVL
ncbi:hypothetical protein HWV62_35929 [Athelia sp. TMB]|nr:hypothetical protein HWV62_35929 [Athelia sp. TMB]